MIPVIVRLLAVQLVKVRPVNDVVDDTVPPPLICRNPADKPVMTNVLEIVVGALKLIALAVALKVEPT